MNEPQHQGASASLRRIRLMARHTLDEALHQRLTVLVIITGAGLIGGAGWLREFNFGRTELKFIGDFGLGVVGFGGTLLAVLTTAHLYFRDIEGRAAYCVLTRPVHRWEFLLGKFAGIAAGLALYTAMLGWLLGALLVWRAAQLGAPAPEVRLFLCAGGVLWLKNTLVAAMTLLVCSYAGSALFASFAGLLLTLLAHLRPLAADSGGLAWWRVWPNLTLFAADSWWAAGLAPSGAWLLGLIAYWAVYMLLLGTVTAYVFKHREF